MWFNQVSDFVSANICFSFPNLRRAYLYRYMHEYILMLWAPYFRVIIIVSLVSLFWTNGYGTVAAISMSCVIDDACLTSGIRADIRSDCGAFLIPIFIYLTCPIFAWSNLFLWLAAIFGVTAVDGDKVLWTTHIWWCSCSTRILSTIAVNWLS